MSLDRFIEFMEATGPAYMSHSPVPLSSLVGPVIPYDDPRSYPVAKRWLCAHCGHRVTPAREKCSICGAPRAD